MIGRLLAAMLLVGAGCSLAACGSGARATSVTVARTAATTSIGASATPTSAAAAKPPTKRQALAFARAVNLTAADVPGFKVSSHHEHETPAEKQLEGEMMRCAGAPSSKDQLVEESSKEFGRKVKGTVQSLQSGVSVARTSALAAKELAAVRSARGRQCFSRYIDQLFKSQKYQGATVGPVSITPGSPSAPGTSGGFAWRIKTAITFRGLRIPFSMDFVGFVYGPAEVALYTFGMPDPLPAAMEEQLFARLLARAKTHDI